MIALVAAFLACGGLTEQETQDGADPSSPSTAAGRSAPSVTRPAPVRVADDIGVPSAIALGSDLVLFTTKQTMLHGRLSSAGGLYVVHKRLGPALLLSRDRGDAHYDALAIDGA
jgi:hypothetical protein